MHDTSAVQTDHSTVVGARHKPHTHTQPTLAVQHGAVLARHPRHTRHSLSHADKNLGAKPQELLTQPPLTHALHIRSTPTARCKPQRSSHARNTAATMQGGRTTTAHATPSCCAELLLLLLLVRAGEAPWGARQARARGRVHARTAHTHTSHVTQCHTHGHTHTATHPPTYTHTHTDAHAHSRTHGRTDSPTDARRPVRGLRSSARARLAAPAACRSASRARPQTWAAQTGPPPSTRT